MESQPRQPTCRSPAMSYYGLCLALVSGSATEARDICEAAVEAAPGTPISISIWVGSASARTIVPTPSAPISAACASTRATRRSSRRCAAGIPAPPRLGFLPRHHPVNRVLDRFAPCSIAERGAARGVRVHPQSGVTERFAVPPRWSHRHGPGLATGWAINR